MLYVFNNNNSVQIAWNAEGPRNKPDARRPQLDQLFGSLGFLRSLRKGR
jgi:hypothetical protein